MKIHAVSPPLHNRDGISTDVGTGTVRPWGFTKRELEEILFRVKTAEVTIAEFDWSGTMTWYDYSSAPLDPGPDQTLSFQFLIEEQTVDAKRSASTTLFADEEASFLGHRAGDRQDFDTDGFTPDVGQLLTALWQDVETDPGPPPVYERQVDTPATGSNGGLCAFHLRVYDAWDDADFGVIRYDGLYYPRIDAVFSLVTNMGNVTWEPIPSESDTVSALALTIGAKEVSLPGAWTPYDSYDKTANTAPPAPAITIDFTSFLTFGGRWNGSTGELE